MKRIDFRIIIGAVLVLAGLLGLLDKFGLFPEQLKAANLFWGSITAVASGAFLYIFFTNRDQWWTALPGFMFLGISAGAFLPSTLDNWDGMAFMTGLSLGFWAVYISSRERWWAIIPAGVLFTLGLVSVLDSLTHAPGPEGVFFLGLGLTFLLVAILPPAGRTWAYIPAAVLIILGVVLGTRFSSLFDYVWIAALFLGGIALIWQYLRNR